MKLYHLSEGRDSPESKTFIPRIPANLYQDEFGNIIEDSKTPRICWSKTIGGAMRAIVDSYGTGYFSVYSSDFNDEEIYQPTKEQVPDCKTTREVWTMYPCEAKKIGYIRSYFDTRNNVQYNFFKNPKWKRCKSKK